MIVAKVRINVEFSDGTTCEANNHVVPAQVANEWLKSLFGWKDDFTARVSELEDYQDSMREFCDRPANRPNVQQNSLPE